MTPILCGRIDYLMAWHGRDLCKEEISFDLSRRHVAALEDVLFSLPRGVACRRPRSGHLPANKIGILRRPGFEEVRFAPDLYGAFPVKGAFPPRWAVDR